MRDVSKRRLVVATNRVVERVKEETELDSLKRSDGGGKFITAIFHPRALGGVNDGGGDGGRGRFQVLTVLDEVLSLAGPLLLYDHNYITRKWITPRAGVTETRKKKKEERLLRITCFELMGFEKWQFFSYR